MGNKKLLGLYKKLIEAQSSIDSVGMKLYVLERRLKKAKRGRDDYAKNIGKVIPSFLSNHKRIYDEAERRYEDARAEGKKPSNLSKARVGIWSNTLSIIAYLHNIAIRRLLSISYLATISR